MQVLSVASVRSCDPPIDGAHLFLVAAEVGARDGAAADNRAEDATLHAGIGRPAPIVSRGEAKGIAQMIDLIKAEAPEVLAQSGPKAPTVEGYLHQLAFAEEAANPRVRSSVRATADRAEGRHAVAPRGPTDRGATDSL